MLNFIYYPVSWVLLAWHWIFDQALGWIPGIEKNSISGLTWALSIIFLVVTIRLILYVPMVKQMRSMTAMQEMAPAMKALQAKYKNDRQRMALEMQNLRKEHGGANPIMGCLPALIQAPVFIALFHVLRSFNKMGSSMRGLGLTAEETRNSSNYGFSPELVRSFLDARFFGAPLSGSMSMNKSEYGAFGDLVQNPSSIHLHIIFVAVPLMLIAALMTHYNARLSVGRQTPEAAAQPQAAMMNKMALWIFPLFILGTGFMWTVGLLVYMMTNNIWTFFQQRHIFNKMEIEKQEKAAHREEVRANLAPKPGAKPVRASKAAVKPADKTADTGTDETVTDDSASDATDVSDKKADTTTPAKKKTSSGKAQPRPSTKQANYDRNRKRKKRR